MFLKNEDSRIKMILLSLLIMLIANVFILRLNPVPGYVGSIYTHISPVFWILSGVIFSVGAFYLISAKSTLNASIPGLAVVILLNNTVILFAPYICGVYLMNGGDLPTHGGMVLDIFSNGRVDFKSNFYPTTHILAYATSAVANADYMATIRNFAPYFTLLIPVYMFILARFITASTNISRLAFVLGSGFYFCSLYQPNSITTPNGLSLLFLPFLAWMILLSKKSNRTVFVALATTMTAYVFFHPITSFILIGSLLLLHLMTRRIYREHRSSGLLYFSCAFGSYVVFLTTVWARVVRNFENFLNGYRISPGTRVDIAENVSRLGIDLGSLVALLVKMFGHQLILLVVSAAFALPMLARMKALRNVNFVRSYGLLIVISIFATGTILLMIQLATPTLLNISFFRFLMYALLFAPLLSAAPLARRMMTRYGRMLVSVLACILFISSMLVLYPSPYANEANSQVTYADLAGSEWMLNHADQLGISGFFGMDLTVRLISGLLPYSNFLAERDRFFDSKSVSPDHFGYDSNSTLWATFGESRYLVITDQDIVSYQDVYASIGRISSEDITKIDHDSTAQLVYDSGEYRTFLVMS